MEAFLRLFGKTFSNGNSGCGRRALPRGWGIRLLTVLVLLGISSTAFAEQEIRFGVLHAGSKFYTNAVVTGRTSTHVFIMHSRGIASVKVSDLEESARTRLRIATIAPKGSIEIVTGQSNNKSTSTVIDTRAEAASEAAAETASAPPVKSAGHFGGIMKFVMWIFIFAGVGVAGFVIFQMVMRARQENRVLSGSLTHHAPPMPGSTSMFRETEATKKDSTANGKSNGAPRPVTNGKADKVEMPADRAANGAAAPATATKRSSDTTTEKKTETEKPAPGTDVVAKNGSNGNGSSNGNGNGKDKSKELSRRIAEAVENERIARQKQTEIEFKKTDAPGQKTDASAKPATGEKTETKTADLRVSPTATGTSGHSEEMRKRDIERTASESKDKSSSDGEPVKVPAEAAKTADKPADGAKTK